MIDYYKCKTGLISKENNLQILLRRKIISCFHCNKYLVCKDRVEDNENIYNILLYLDKQKHWSEYIRSINIMLAMGCLEYKSII